MTPQQPESRSGSQPGNRPGERPRTELDARYSSALNPRPGAEGVTATDWAEAQRRMRAAEVFWITTVRPDGRLHVTPLIAAWHDGALHFSTGPGEQKAKNLAGNAHCVLTTGQSALSGSLDIVVEGLAERVTDPARQDEVIDAFEEQYGDHITSPDGTFHGFGDSIRTGDDLLFAVAPGTAYGFGRDGRTFSHTRYSFS
ncbi:pyridoxamine 5'-phosphate oxidase family protein [Streptomyces lichenis]|uniref:Pyridoxamine 5'-phosphate oxidase family protein n=1 Tax=Streptomyces lichenis TaxID=2306967 RepID=A0ABT0ICQ2_9ACTN|nr:pyridoxamine 5'-phosphate oxidase family protein [Streptomyces lichenis]MCK8679104.1 pyridoxamine 5'-phosphate oxidase family protein [Streptomyces lichenis]